MGLYSLYRLLNLYSFRNLWFSWHLYYIFSIKSIWDILLNRLKTDCQVHEQHAQEYMQIIVPRLVQSDEIVARTARKSSEIGSKYHTELEDQMKRLDRTLKYYIQSRQSEHNAKSKLSDLKPPKNESKADSKIERRLSKVSSGQIILKSNAPQKDIKLPIAPT